LILAGRASVEQRVEVVDRREVGRRYQRVWPEGNV
jgi:hypothetical protein